MNEASTEMILYHRTVMGLWLPQESIKTWERGGASITIEELVSVAAGEEPLRSVFEPSDAVFYPPGDIPSRIAQVCRESGELVPETPAQVTRSILDSLALAYRHSLCLGAELSKKRVEAIHIVGGGVHNARLCQLTADACGLPVVAGPVEAAAIGNALVQAQALGSLAQGRWAARAIVASRMELFHYAPSQGEAARWQDAAERLSAHKGRWAVPRAELRYPSCKFRKRFI